MLLSKRSMCALSAVALGAALSATACTQETPAEPSDEYISESVRSDVLERVEALNYPYDSDPTFGVRIANLQTRLIDDCVRATGVVPPNTPELAVGPSAVTPSQTRLWLLPGTDYGVAEALSDPAVVADLSTEESEDGGAAPPDPQAYDRAVYGPENERIELPIPGGGKASVPIGGCFGQATEQMYGVEQAADYERAYYEIPNAREVMAELAAKDEVRAATSVWSTCMRDVGYRLDDPTGLYELMDTWIGGVIEGEMSLSDVRREEAQVAADDLGCRTSSGLGTVLARQFIAVADDEIEGKEGVVQEYRRMIEHAQAEIARD